MDNTENDAEVSVELNVNIDADCEVGGKLSLKTEDSFSLKKPISDIDQILGAQNDSDSETDEEENVHAGIGIGNVGNGVNGISGDVELSPDLRLNLAGDIKASIDDECRVRKVIEVNKDYSRIPARDPDIHIHIDMDEINKTANFVIDLPDKWSKKLINKWDEPKYRKLFNGNVDYDTNEREKERLDVEINMFLGKENLEDSTIYALINPINIADDISDSKRFDFQLPKFQLPRFDLPTFSLRNKSANVDTEVSPIDGDVTVPDGELELDGSAKRHDFRFQMPKIDFPSLSFKGRPKADANIDADLEPHDADVDADIDAENSTKRKDFRFKLPKVDLSIFGNFQKSADANVDVELNEDVIHADEGVALRSEMSIESTTKRYDFRYQLPKIEFPSLNRKASASLDADIDADNNGNLPEAELNADGSVKRHDFRFQLPEIQMPTLIYKPKSHNASADIDMNNNKADINADLELEIPSTDLNRDKFFKKPDFNFQLPTMDFSLFGNKNKTTDADLDVDAEVDVGSPTKRLDFRYQLPKINFPSINIKGRSNVDDDLDLDVDADGNVSDANIEITSPTKRADFSFKLPKVDFSVFGRVQKPESVNAEAEIDINDDEIHAEVATVQKCEMDIDGPPKRHDFRYQLPKIDFPSIGIKGKTNVEADADVDADTNADSSGRSNFKFQMPKINFPSFHSKDKHNAEVDVNADANAMADVSESDDHVKRHDFRFQLPKIELPSFSIRQKIDTTQTFGLVLHEDTRRYDFSFSYPESRYTTSDGKVEFRDDCAEHDNDYNVFSIVFDEGDSTRTEANIFKFQLKNGIITCCEVHSGEVQETTESNVVCYSPKKNWLVVFLPESNDSDLVVVFNEEVILKYRLKGSINTLQSFDLEGSVKLNAAKLFGE